MELSSSGSFFLRLQLMLRPCRAYSEQELLLLDALGKNLLFNCQIEKFQQLYQDKVAQHLEWVMLIEGGSQTMASSLYDFFICLKDNLVLP